MCPILMDTLDHHQSIQPTGYHRSSWILAIILSALPAAKRHYIATNIFAQENAFKKIVGKMVAIFVSVSTLKMAMKQFLTHSLKT